MQFSGVCTVLYSAVAEKDVHVGADATSERRITDRPSEGGWGSHRVCGGAAMVAELGLFLGFLYGGEVSA